MQQVERGQLWVMRIHALAGGLAAMLVGGVAELVLREQVGLPVGTVLLPLALLLLYPVLIAPARRFRALRYRMDPDELYVARGVWMQVETVVPLERVQHIDVSQGPLERAFGVARLVLHTAGTMNSLVLLPGLSRDTAEAMRDKVRTRIQRGEL